MFAEPKQITVVVEMTVYDQLAAQSRQSRLPMAELIRRALDAYLEDDGMPDSDMQAMPA
jgi:hypothetical protein